MITSTFTAIGNTSISQSFEHGQVIVVDVTFDAEGTGGTVVLEKSTLPLNGAFEVVATTTDETAIEYENTADKAWFRTRCLTLTETESLAVAMSEKFEAIEILITDKADNALNCRCLAASIPTGSGFAKGCFLTATDGTDDTNTLYVNIGTAAAANFNLVTVVADA